MFVGEHEQEVSCECYFAMQNAVKIYLVCFSFPVVHTTRYGPVEGGSVGTVRFVGDNPPRLRADRRRNRQAQIGSNRPYDHTKKNTRTRYPLFIFYVN